MANVMIPEELFLQLIRFHLTGDISEEEDITAALDKKLDAMVMRELYTRSKSAPTPEEREQARQEYLYRRGVPESFRW